VAATVMLMRLLFVLPGRNLSHNDYVASIDMACQLHHSSCLQHGMVWSCMERLLFIEAMAGGHSTVIGLDLHVMISLLMVNPVVGVFHRDRLQTAIILFMFACMHIVIKFRRDGDWTGEPG
jgi:hypothetical protein